MQYLQTRAGTCLSTNDVIKCTDNDILKLYQPGLGALAEEILQTAKKPKLECALALCNSCTNTSVTRNSPLDTDELNTCFSVSLQEAQIESIFLCDGHYLKHTIIIKVVKLNQYMYEQGTSDKILTTGDVICKKCHSILYRYTGQQQHDKKVECVSPREYVSLILKQAVSGTLDIDIPDINKLALTELIKFVCTELMQNKAFCFFQKWYTSFKSLRLFFIKSETKPDQIYT
ncbi:unnamed protein product [Mytilus coruscus]|uniref:Uncharacterized protein n=1 Tax=Mytilus coruscus TaxID=42192 RepID=A0A6J8ECG7_MYTCO|nr:unnamed protein product [Mytilus coruscus]